jgi:hypothetical protein
VERWVAKAIAEEGATYVSRVQAQHGEVPQQTLLEAVQHVVQAGRAMTFGGSQRSQTAHQTWCPGHRLCSIPCGLKTP